MRLPTFLRTLTSLSAVVGLTGCAAISGNDWGELAPGGASGTGGSGGGGTIGGGGGTGGIAGDASVVGDGNAAAAGTGGASGSDSSAGGSGGIAGGSGGSGGTGGTDSSAGSGGSGGTGGGGSGGTGGADATDGHVGIDASADAGGPGNGDADANIDGSGIADVAAEASSDAYVDVATPDAALDTGTPVAADGGVFVPSNAPSCAQPDGGILFCNGESCCTSINVPGGEFMQGRSTAVDAGDYFPTGELNETPEFASKVSPFALDKYEVTVGRFRKYVQAYLGNGVDGGTATVPAAGDGANLNVSGSGWRSAWNAFLPATQAAFTDTSHLKCSASLQTWDDVSGLNENMAINCLNFYEAFAFCIWDGGRLPTESEWEYASAGGDQNRLYPWGGVAPDCGHANYYYCYGGGQVLAVGSLPSGTGRWGHADLAGNVYEWVLDWYGVYPAGASTDYANLSGTERLIRGGNSTGNPFYLRATFRGFTPEGNRGYGLGIRCARSSQ